MLKQPAQKSLIRRVILSVTLVNLVFWVAACAMAAYVMYNEYGEAFDGTLMVTAERLLPLALSDVQQNKSSSNLLVKTDNHDTPAEYITYQVFDHSGKIVMRSEDAPAAPYGAPLKTGYFKTEKYRIYSLASQNGQYFIQVADRFFDRREAATEAMTALLLPAILLIPLSIFAIVIVLRRQLVPIHELSEAISQKNSGDLEFLEEGGITKEFLPIIQSVNLFMGRLKAALEAERSFTSNSAHELRTPVAAALAHTQMLIEELPPRYRERTREVEASLQRLRRLSEKLLQLARADAKVGITSKPTDMLPYLYAVMDDFQRTGLHEERLHILMQTDKLTQPINGDAFGIVIRNLVENALNYSPAESTVQITIAENMISIINDCPLIDESELKLLTSRFYRGDDNKEGSGLGLSIVNALAKSMKITISYHSPLAESNRGFEARILF